MNFKIVALTGVSAFLVQNSRSQWFLFDVFLQGLES